MSLRIYGHYILLITSNMFKEISPAKFVEKSRRQMENKFVKKCKSVETLLVPEDDGSALQSISVYYLQHTWQTDLLFVLLGLTPPSRMDHHVCEHGQGLQAAW